MASRDVDHRGRSGLRMGIALAAVLSVLASAPAAARCATLLYPDLKTLPPRDLRFDRADVDPDGGGVMHNVLRFTNTVWDDGPGRLEVRGTIDPSSGSGPATQRVYDDAGGSADFAAGSFYYHEAHHHYHYDEWGRYQLWTRAGYEAWLASGRTGGSPLLGSKTTSCMMDEEFIRDVPNQPYPPLYEAGGCLPDSNGQMLQGISPGWGDTYDYFRFEQWIDLGASGSLADGQYVLRSLTDPLNKIYESPGKSDPTRESQEDNEAVTPFAVSGGKLVDSNPPSGSVWINNVDVATASPNVIVKVLGRDDVSGVTEVRLSDDGSQWSAPQPYTGQESTAQSFVWNLADPAYGGGAADGTKTVFAEFRDASGKWSAPETDTIVLDRSGSSSSYSNAVLADSPAGYWRLGETGGTTASDAAGANPGTYRSGPALGQPSLLPADPANESVRFDGGDECLQIHSSSPLSPPLSASVEAWIKPSTVPAPGEFASIASKPGSYSLQLDGPQLEFAIIQAGGYRRVRAPIGAIEPGHVYHVVGTYDGTRQRLYVDGSEVASQLLTGAISTSDGELSIGCWTEGHEPFSGTIDEVAVYDSALSAARIEAHRTAGTDGSPPDTAIAAPSGLSATAVSGRSIELHWSDNADNEDEFRIERATDPGFSSPVVQAVWANTTSFTDGGLSPGTTYYYRVRARSATDSSAYSNPASAMTPGEPQEGPSSPAAKASTSSRHPALQGDAYGATVVGDRPLGFWRLDESSGSTAHDVRGASPGAYRGGPELGQPSLLPANSSGRSAGFANGQRVEVSDSSSLRVRGRVSVEAWIEPRALPGRRGVALIAGEPGSYALRLEGARLAFAVGRGPHAGGRVRAHAGMLAAGEAHYVVATYNGTVAELFVDGTKVAGARVPSAHLGSTRPFEIGSATRQRGQFRGAIDEVALYGKPLTPAQVSDHYRAGAWPRLSN